ncbi:DNA/RNA nuclease SfsA [Haliangium sp.]|uniref:DNA/RNA nuclease SfsA n=1 Tax=Haliangium sp. TaxID=2663208 RepID=UPI003D0E4DB9
MEFPHPLIEARLVRRYKRFLADVILPDGSEVVAHCPNPGAMTTCMVEGGRVWVSQPPRGRRKLAYTWEVSEVPDDDGTPRLVCVNTARANQVVAEALAAGRVPELAGYHELRPEVRLAERTRVDFVLADWRPGPAPATAEVRGCAGQRCFLEVKSVTLQVEPGLAAFPDSVSARASRHAADLMTAVALGDRAVMLFLAARSGVEAVRTADEIDPYYGRILRRAAEAGVEVLAYGCALSTTAISLSARLPLRLP